MVNDNGGVNGRKINFISYDDAYSPPKTVEQTRKLIEGDEVLLTFNGMGTGPQAAVHKYHNMKKVPQLFVGSGGNKWNNPKEFPWTMGFQPSNLIVARIYAKYILKEKPDAKVGLLYQNDDFGKEFVAGLNEVFGDKASRLIIAQSSYETSEPTIDSHIAKLMASGADVFVNVTTPKFAAQGIKKASELGWKPAIHLVTPASISLNGVMRPAGLEASEGILGANFMRDASDPQWNNDPAMKRFKAFIDKYMPGTDLADTNVVYGYACAQTVVKVLEQAGDNLTRENLMKQAANLKGFSPDTLLPGITIDTSPTDFGPIKQLQLMRFRNGGWQLFGEVISAGDGG
jgi:branched-chain amino acid transport system substrate-binding protein